MIAWRYDLEDPLTLLEPRGFSHIVNFSNGHFPSNKGVFLSAIRLPNVHSAHDYSAITYYPRSESEFDLDPAIFELRDNHNRIIDKNTSIGDIPRSWPAFGSFGGTREVILAENSKFNSKSPIAPCNHRSFKDGGEFDYYKQDNTVSYGELVARAIAGGASENPENAGPLSITKSDSGTVVLFRLGKYQYSISSATKSFGKTAKIHFWGYKWVDEGSIPLRKVYGPLQETIVFTCLPKTCPNVMAKLENNLKSKFYPYRDIKELSEQFLDLLTRVTEQFFNQTCIRWPLI